MDRQPLVSINKPNYAGIYLDDNITATSINMVHAYEQIAVYAGNMPALISVGEYSENRIIIGQDGDYEVEIHFDATSAGVNKEYEFNPFEIAVIGKRISGASQADPCVISCPGHEFFDGQMVKLTSIKGMIELNDRIFTVANRTVNDFELQNDNAANIDSSLFTEYDSVGIASLAIKIEQVHIHRIFEVPGDVGAMGSSGFASLKANNYLEAWVKCITDTTDLTVESGQLTIKRL